MTTCKVCGASVMEGHAFCTQCGSPQSVTPISAETLKDPPKEKEYLATPEFEPPKYPTPRPFSPPQDTSPPLPDWNTAQDPSPHEELFGNDATLSPPSDDSFDNEFLSHPSSDAQNLQAPVSPQELFGISDELSGAEENLSDHHEPVSPSDLFGGGEDLSSPDEDFSTAHYPDSHPEHEPIEAADTSKISSFRILSNTPDGDHGPSISVRDAAIVGTSGDLKLLDDDYVAPEHAFFGLHDSKVEVTNLPESTGTWLALSPNNRIRVSSGGMLRLGHQVLEFQRLPPQQDAQTNAWGTTDNKAIIRVIQRLDGGVYGAAWTLGVGEWTIGREGCDLSFPDDGFLSGHHGKICVSQDGAMAFEDLGSSNGTYIAIEKTTTLNPDDRILIGNHLLTIEME